MKAQDIEFSYGSKALFQNLNVTIKPNAITSIIGPNGSGKSTLLQLLSGHLKPNKGMITLKGNRIAHYHPKALARQMATVHQNGKAPQDFTVKEVIRFGRYSYQSLIKRDKRGTSVISDILKQLNLEDKADVMVSQLSGGEMQRVFIAMALAQEPEYLLLDEPTTFLDIHYQYQVLDILKTLNQAYNLTIVMVLHDINQALNYSDEIICMQNGSIKAQGKSKSVITSDLLKEVYHIDAKVFYDSSCGWMIGKCTGGLNE